jgi:sugar lactone lactonase YvrE
MMGGLNRPEGIAVAKDGTIYVAETATGRVLAYKSGDVRTVVNDLEEPDQVELAPDGALWITEDTKSGRLMRYKDGSLAVVLSGLRNPQGIAFLNHGTVLVAEQGRGRILAVMSAPLP